MLDQLDITNSTLLIASEFSPRLLNSVHSLAMILVWLINFQSQLSPRSVWKYNFAPVFVLKYSFFLINNSLLAFPIGFNTDYFRDFLILLSVLFWCQNLNIVRKLIMWFKSDTLDSFWKLIFKIIFHFLFALFRIKSLFTAFDLYYSTDKLSLIISWIVLLEFTSIMILWKNKDTRKFFSSFVSSAMVAIATAVNPQLSSAVIFLILYRHIYSVIRQSKVVPKSIPNEGRARQPHLQRPKKTSSN